MYEDTGLRITKSNPRYSVCHCPLPGHNDTHASSVIYHDTNMFVCFRCHVRLPLEKLLEDLGLGIWNFERKEEFNPILYDEPAKFQPLTGEALDYLRNRGIEELEYLPEWVASPGGNQGIAFLFRNQGRFFGQQIRLFPYFLKNENMRYVLEGKRLPWFGDLVHSKQFKTKLICFEKAFGALKGQMAANKFGLPVTAISSAGSHYQRQILELVGLDTVFIFDNDAAGLAAGKEVRKLGFRVIIPKLPIDEESIDGVRRIITKIIGE